MRRTGRTEQKTLNEKDILSSEVGDTGSECVFCQIAARKKDSHTVFQDELTTAFLDSKPLFPGHTLLITNKHYKTISDLPSSVIGPVFANARLLAAAVIRGMNADGSFIGINSNVSQSVPHFHVHIVPRRVGDGLKGFFWPRQKYGSSEEMEKVAKVIRQALVELRGEQDKR
jgi:histidine triad (HIT) family protein